MDGDFLLEASDDVDRNAVPRSPLRLDQLDESLPRKVAAESVLRRLELSDTFQPPIANKLVSQDRSSEAQWVETTLELLQYADEWDDLRFFNTACKAYGVLSLLGTQKRRSAIDLGLNMRARSAELNSRLSSMGVCRGEPTDARYEFELTPGSGARLAPTVCLVAGEGSSSATTFLRAAERRGVAVQTTLTFASMEKREVPDASHYARAWYPPSTGSKSPTSKPDATKTTRGWESLSAEIPEGTDVLILMGMPIVPSDILERAGVVTLNAHNALLPYFRGMDAVGWALLEGAHIGVTVHGAVERVDAGPIYLRRPVPAAPLLTLRNRIRDTQAEALLDVLEYLSSEAALPEALRVQTSERLYYRLHPHLKRILDTSICR